MKSINLNRQLFKDTESLEKFKKVFENLSDLTLIVHREKVIGSFLSLESTKDFLYNKLGKNIK